MAPRLGLKDIYNREIKSDDFYDKYKIIIQRAIEKVENGIKSHSDFYRRYYVKTYFGGSQYDQLQINQRQEADVNIVLDLSQENFTIGSKSERYQAECDWRSSGNENIARNNFDNFAKIVLRNASKDSGYYLSPVHVFRLTVTIMRDLFCISRTLPRW